MTGSNNLQDAGAVTTCQMMSHHLPLAYLQSHSFHQLGTGWHRTLCARLLRSLLRSAWTGAPRAGRVRSGAGRQRAALRRAR